MQLPRLAPALGALALACAACSGPVDPVSETNAGYAALGRGDAERALDHFASALAALAPDDPGYPRARMGEIECKAHLAPGPAAKSFLEYARAAPQRVSAEDHRRVGALLAGLGAFDPAIDVLHSGHERFPADERIVAAMESIKAAALAGGDDAAYQRIKGLGYAGG